MSRYVAKERIGDVVSLVLDAPERRNALSFDLLAELSKTLTEGTDGATGIVISGSGGAFSAGADFTNLTGTSRDIDFDDALERVVEAIMSSPIPVVAAVEGPCIGAGAHLALACDLRIAGAGSFLQIPAVRLGLLYSPRAIAWLAGTFPRDTVRRMLLLGERFDAADAVEARLFSKVVPTGTALDKATQALAALSPDHLDALASTRELLNSLDANQYDEATWQQRRKNLLDSPARAQAIRQAQARHT
ncbi:enoyl-CoA hydratase/carnithine racemase [Arthrobacter ginsengisoli]|uniref:Enoyl-CoA hydratase/carnithine racemase n=1 Tax=Arthrobacter ginsengisoli TaxID=1356565 RepID=A0ABU1UDR9_9MICC|nr:enoyl-CoA hydratase/isomerase family protein [Arthrobacter ginsengisoli]MDR7083353.1 enoyl-CoA hydratase/carnithine racemase [Arthrobacter ginsengisoli]